MSLKLRGEVIHKGSIQYVTDKFKKQNLVISDGHHSFPTKVCFEAQNNEIASIESIEEGDIVEVEFFPTSKDWVNKEGVVQWFNTNKLIKINVLEKAKSANPVQNGPALGESTHFDDLPL